MISVAVQKGSSVYVYNEKNNQIFVLGGTLVGYTSSSVSIKKLGLSAIYTYDDKGRQISVH